MTSSPCCCSPSDTVQDVARMMRDYDCGSIPVVDTETECIVGVVTDRDLSVRGLAAGKLGDARVGDVMTARPFCCRADAAVRDIERTMSDHQVRRVPIVDAEGRCVGIVSQADLARAAAHGARVSDREVAIVVERISEPAGQSRGRASGIFTELLPRM
jgi:CBS domain-containing protein